MRYDMCMVILCLWRNLRVLWQATLKPMGSLSKLISELFIYGNMVPVCHQCSGIHWVVVVAIVVIAAIVVVEVAIVVDVAMIFIIVVGNQWREQRGHQGANIMQSWWLGGSVGAHVVMVSFVTIVAIVFSGAMFGLFIVIFYIHLWYWSALGMVSSLLSVSSASRQA